MTREKIVVYTAVFNDYDVVLPPKVNPDNVDFVCFTDNPETIPDEWEKRLISNYDISPKLMSGKVKTLPHRFFPEYDYSIWVDGRMHVIGDVREVIESSLQETNMAVPPHPNRDCIYEEAEACIDLGRGDPEKIHAQIDRYREMGFPQKYGLSATWIVIRKHNEDDVINAMEVWWEEYQKGAERDQLSFEFAAWKCGLQYQRLKLNYMSSAEYFYIYPHKPEGIVGEVWELILRRKINTTGVKARILDMLFRKLCFRYAEFTPRTEGEHSYFDIY